LNRVFDAIGFVYLDYRFPAQKRGLKRKNVSRGFFYYTEAKEGFNPPTEVVLRGECCTTACHRDFRNKDCRRNQRCSSGKRIECSGTYSFGTVRTAEGSRVVEGASETMNYNRFRGNT
jgi:hypothetical protein